MHAVEKSENSKVLEITLHSFALELNDIFMLFKPAMSDTSQEDAQEEDIAPCYNKLHELDGFSTQEYVDRAGEGPIDIDGYNSDSKSVSDSSNTGESDVVRVQCRCHSLILSRSCSRGARRTILRVRP
jgi:hypothetical protein